MLLEEISSRKSVRSYSEQPISDETLNEILEAGRLAPSWVNVQPWKFIVIKDEKTKELLFKASGDQKQVLGANVIIACVADMEAWDKKNFGAVLEKSGRNQMVQDFILNSPMLNPSLLGDIERLTRTIEQLTYAVAYMSLQAEKSGVGCCIIGALANEMTKGDANIIKELKERLNLSDRQVLLTLLTLGYDKNPKETKKIRKEAEEVIFFEKL
ncbi:MAG: nitroreductase family protein [Fusobacterium sp.]|nr:nitroreductase family protein [Fusobacterium sp.]